MVGPALAGIAIAFGSYTTAFAINALSFAVMLLALRALRLEARPKPTDDDPLVRRMVVGAKAAWAEPGVR